MGCKPGYLTRQSFHLEYLREMLPRQNLATAWTRVSSGV
jgi:hypothetical protein